jgi:hypothetical protein
MIETSIAELDRWLSPRIRERLEQSYYAEVNNRARFESLIRDPSFLEALRLGEPHVGLFSDHGVVHARDVAGQVLRVLERVHGLLIPGRSAWRLASMMGYGVLLAYVHDIGMVDFSAYGRAMHPESAVHSIFSAAMDDVIEDIWRENSANLAWRLYQLAEEGALTQPPQTVLREMLALAVGHSKSKVPVAVLNDRAALRRYLIDILASDLHTLYRGQLVEKARRNLVAAQVGGNPAEVERCRAALAAAEAVLPAGSAPPDTAIPVADNAFAWLLSDHPATRLLADDAVDTVRALRAADALRKRGLVLKTSGGSEMFISRVTGRAVYSFQSSDGRLYLLEAPNPVSAGEAIIAGSEVDGDGNLRIAFHRGAFDTPEATEFAVGAAAGVIHDILQDTLGSFQRPAHEPAEPLKPIEETQLLLEEADDSAEFVALVRQRIMAADPTMRSRVRLVPSLREASERERALYLSAAPVDWELPARLELLQRLRQAGQLCDRIDPDLAFQDARTVTLQPGEVLIEAGAPAAFVYIPMAEGLRIIPLGGYDAMTARPWTPLGLTGVIRGAPRNATVVAETFLQLLMIPKGVYIREWYSIHTPQSFLATLEKTGATSPLSPDSDGFTNDPAQSPL